MDKIRIGTAGGDDIWVAPQCVQQVRCFNGHVTVLFKDGSPDCVRYGDELCLDRQKDCECGQWLEPQTQAQNLRHYIASAAEYFYENNTLGPVPAPKQISVQSVKDAVKGAATVILLGLPR